MIKKLYHSQRSFLWLISGLLIIFILGTCRSWLESKDAQLTPPKVATSILEDEAMSSSRITFITFPTPIFISTRVPEMAISVHNDELKQRWLTPAQCQPPCWEGVIPGKTTAIEAAEILSTNPLFTKVEVIKSPLGDTGFINFEWNIEDLRRGDILFDYASPDQTIYMIRMGIPELHLGELIETYGKPSYIVAGASPTVDIGGPQIWRLDVVWFPQGFMVSTDKFSESRVDENLSLDAINYFSSSWAASQDVNNFSSNKMKPWKGYGDFDLYTNNDQ